MSKFEDAIPRSIGELLSYDGLTGEFRWKVKPARRISAGAVAGCLDGKGYWQIRVFGKRHFAHRLAWELFYGVKPTGEIDHKNGVKTDNRIENLRIAMPAQNMANHGISRANTSGFKGVSRLPSGSWVGRLSHAYKRYSTPACPSAEEAFEKLNAIRIRVHGEYANAGDFQPEQQKAKEEIA
ncbi:HNH endonuclease [Pseudomonas nitroreducens]|uniref:HNH endonuclease n=1 Tax=Pseudomonas nitroreducens TaxID=46680 RepID=UPI003D2DCAB3